MMHQKLWPGRLPHSPRTERIIESTPADNLPLDRRSAAESPRVWTLLGAKSGDNNQVIALAESLGYGWIEKRFSYIPLELVPNRLLGVTLKGVKNRDDVDLSPPWPDLVISAGRRNEPIARWIKKMAGANCKLVHMGRPWAHPKFFDLIITTPQYDLGSAPNILHNKLPLHRVNIARLEEAKSEWTSKLEHLPRPWTAVLVGGNSSTVRFTAPSLVYLAQEANRIASTDGGSLLITTSARTPVGTMSLLRNHLEVPSYLHDFAPNDVANPYHAFLALADRFIVTGESISMLTESCFTGKPVHVFDPAHPNHQGDTDHPLSDSIEMTRPGRAWGTWLRDHLGPKRLRRDITQIHKNLSSEKRILWLGESEADWAGSPVSSDLESATERTRALIKQSGQ